MKTNFNEVEINGTVYVPKDSVSEKVINTEGLQYVLIRSYAAGVHVGALAEKEDTLSGRVVKLVDSRRIWYWAGASSLSQLATEGTKDASSCKFSVVVPEIEIINVIEIIPLNAMSKENIYSVAVWKN